MNPDPSHTFEAVEQQVFGSGSISSMSGFVEQSLSVSQNLSQTVMKGFKPQNMPVLRKLKYISKFQDYDSDFKKKAKDGKLPSWTVIEPRYFDLEGNSANDDHPSQDVAN